MASLSDWFTSRVRPLHPSVEKYRIRIICDTPPQNTGIDELVEQAFDETERVMLESRAVWRRVSGSTQETRETLEPQLRRWLEDTLSESPFNGNIGVVKAQQKYDNYYDVPYEENEEFAEVSEEAFEFMRRYSNFDELDEDTTRRKLVETASRDPKLVTEYKDVNGVDTSGNIYAFQAPSWLNSGLRGHHGVYLPASLRKRLCEATIDEFDREVHKAAMKTAITAEVVLPENSIAYVSSMSDDLASDLEKTGLVTEVYDKTVVGPDGEPHEQSVQSEDARDQLAVVEETD